MQYAASQTSPKIVAGQRYQINSFDLGFINIVPVELLLEVKRVDPQRNELELWALPASGQEAGASLVAIARWFGDIYPARTAEDCLLKNVAAFERLVDIGAAVLDIPPPITPVSPTLLAAIQQRLPWPTLPAGTPDQIF